MIFPFSPPKKEQRDLIIFWSKNAVSLAKRKGVEIERVTPFSFGKISGGTKAITIVFESDAGVSIDERLVWTRERPQDEVTLPEMRAILHELDVRSKERIRREGWEGGTLIAAPMVRCSIRFDGKRILNPIGFTGKLLTILARQLWLSPSAGVFIRDLREHLPKAAFSLCFADDIAATLFTQLSPDLIVLLQDRTTVVTKLSGDTRIKRSVCAIGQDSIVKALARQLDLSSKDEAGRLLRALARGDLHKSLRRKIEGLLAPLLLAWGRAIIDMSGSYRRNSKAPESILFLATGRTLPPFQKGLTEKVLNRLLPFTQGAACYNATVRDALNIPLDEQTGEDAIWLRVAAHVASSIPSEFAL